MNRIKITISLWVHASASKAILRGLPGPTKTGCLGKDVATDSARNAARIAALNALAVAVAHHN